MTAEEQSRTPTLGQILRHLRRTKNLRLKDVAARIDCSESMLSKVENDRTPPSLHLLHQIAEALGTNVQSLFSDVERPVVTVYRPGERPMLDLDGPNASSRSQVSLERLTPYSPDRTLNANVHVVPPGTGSNGQMRHKGEEVGYVLEGWVELVVDGVSNLLGPGSSFFFNSTLPHGYRNIGTDTARIVWVNSPPY